MVVGCNKRRLSMDDSVEGIFDRFAESLNQLVSVNLPPFMLPPPPPPDKAALFGNLIAAQLKEIDSQLLDNTMLQVMKLINDAKKNDQKYIYI